MSNAGAELQNIYELFEAITGAYPLRILVTLEVSGGLNDYLLRSWWYIT
jgi:hypothetical protein